MKNTILLDKFQLFTKDANVEIPSTIRMDKELLPELFHDFKYPISSWPILLNESQTNDLDEICTAIPKLLAQIPSLYFDNDIKKIADFYFNGDEMSAELAMMCIKKNMDISSRLDLTLTKNGFKVLEVNMGSSIGGMEFQNFEPLIRRLHEPLSKPELANSFISKPTQSIYIEFLVDKILEYVSKDLTEINIFLSTGLEEGNLVRETINQFFDDLLNKELKKRSKTGRVVSGRVKDLRFDNRRLDYKTIEIHAVLALDYAMKEISMNLFRALAMDKVYFPDHQGAALLGDKRNLSLLYELALENKFDEDDKQLILNCIPWTTNLEEKEVFYRDGDYDLMNLVCQFKDDFVVKISDGLQGDDVYIGKDVKKEDWKPVVEDALKRKKFIVQEYCESIDLLAPDRSNQWLPHKLVWGAFGFGKQYGGVWVRMNTKGNGSEVINSATGAVEAIVYESY